MKKLYLILGLISDIFLLLFFLIKVIIIDKGYPDLDILIFMFFGLSIYTIIMYSYYSILDEIKELKLK